jgi:hypothetical protein
MEEQKKQENPKMVRDWSTGKWMTEEEWWALEMGPWPWWFYLALVVLMLLIGVLHDACR